MEKKPLLFYIFQNPLFSIFQASHFNRKLILWVSLLCLTSIANAQTAEYYQNYVIVNSGGGNNYIVPGGLGSLGTFSCSGTLLLNGAQTDTKKSGTCDITGSHLMYRIYLSGSSSLPAFSDINLPFSADYGSCFGNTGTCQRWENNSAGINLLNGLADGTYTLELYFVGYTQFCGVGNFYNSNGGGNYFGSFTVSNPMTITAQPVAPIVCNGSNTTLSATATGVTGYIWQKQNGATWVNVSSGSITSGSAAVLNLSNVTSTDVYRCLFTNCGGINTLATNNVTVTPQQPTITTQPISQTDCAGNDIVFSVTATGATPFTYQWYKKVPGGSFVSVIGDANITTPSVNSIKVDNIGDAALANPNQSQYQCVVTDANGCTVTSTAAIMTVNSIVGTLASQTICEGSNATYSISTTGSIISYQWQKKTGSAGTWADITTSGGGKYSGYTSASLTITGATNASDNDTYYQCVVLFSITAGNDNGSGVTTCPRTSDNARLLVNLYPATPVHANATEKGCVGLANTLNSTGCSPNVTTWYDASNNVVNIGANYSLTINTPGSYVYYATCKQLSSGCESPKSTGVTFTVAALPTITLSPVADICNTATSFSLPYTSTTGSPNRYSISAGTPALSGFTAIPNTTTLPASPISVVIPANSTPNTYQFVVSVRSTTTTCISTPQNITVKINPTPVAPTVTTPINYCQNASTTALTATASSTLQWYGTNSTGGVASTTAPTPSSATVGTTTYYVSQKDANNCESTRASIAVVTNANPVAPTATTSISYCKNATATALTATAASGNSLVWYDSNDVILASAPTPTTTTVGTQTYKVSQKTPAPANCESPKTTITVTINDNPLAPTVTTPVGYCQNATTIALSATASGTLQWYGTNSTGGVASSTAPTPSTATSGTSTYYVSQKDGNNCESPRAGIDVIISPALTVSVSGNNIFCNTGEINKISTITALPSGGNGTFTYQWQNTSGNISGATNATYDVSLGNQAVSSMDYKVVVTSGYCTVTSAIKTVSQNGVSDTPTVTGNTANCGGSATLIANTTFAGGTFRWYKEQTDATEATGGTISGTRHEQFITPILTSNTYYYVARELSLAGVACQTNRVQTTIILTPIAAPTVTSPITYCQNTTSTALSATGTNLLWYADATTITSSSTAPTPSTATVGTTSYYVSQTVSGCESTRSKIDVTVNAIPTAPTVTSPITYCQNSTSTALTATGTNLLWYADATTTTSSSIAPTPSTATVGTTSYYVSQTVSGCESARSKIDVTVNAIPTAPTVTSPITYCQNATSTALSATGTNLLWYADATTTTSSSTAPTPSTATVGTTSYYVSQTVSGCESARSKIDVTVNAIPTAPTVTSPITYCQNATSTALTATGTNLLWYADATTTTSSSIAPTPNTATVGTTSYYVSQTVSGCESARSKIDVTVNTIPTAPTVTSPITYCQNAISTALTATGTNLLWYADATTTTSSSIAPTPSTATVGTTSYYVSQTVSGCESARSKIDVTVNAIPTAPTVTSPITYCQNTTSTALTATGTNLLWYADATTTTSSSTASTPSTATVGTTSYYVSQTVSGCESARSKIDVTITANPSLPTIVNSANKTTFCNTESAFTLTPTCATGSAQFRLNSGAWAAVSSNISVNPAAYSSNTTLSYDFKCVNGSCESSATNVALTINAAPQITTQPSNQTNCKGNSVTFSLTTSPSSGVTYQWQRMTPSSSVFTDISGAVSASLSLTNIGDATNPHLSQYQCVVSLNGCSIISNIVTLTVNSFTGTIASQTKCEGANVTFDVPNIAIVGTVAANPYQWEVSSTSSTTGFSPITGANSASYTINSVLASDGNKWYRLRVNFTNTVSGNCSITITGGKLTVTVIAPPTISVDNSTICAGSSAKLTATGCTGIVNWSNSQTGTQITVSPTANTSYTATCTQSGCTSTASNQVDIVVNSKPSSPVLDGTSPICEGQSSTLTASSCAGTLLWASGETTTSISVSPIITSLYSATCTVNGCQSDASSAFQVVVNPKPSLPTNTTVSPVCDGTTLTFSATGNSLLWYAASTGGIGSTAAPTYTAVGTYTAYVSQTDANACESNRLTISGEITTKPIAPIAVGSTICIGNSVTLTISTTCAGTLTWYETSGGAVATMPVSPTIDTEYFAKCKVGDCKSDASNSVKVVVNPKPDLPINTTPSAICEGTTLEFSAAGTGLLWYNTATGGTGSTTAPTYTAAGTYTYWVSQTNVSTCESDRLQITATIKAKPTITVQPTNQTDCKGNGVTFAVTATASSGTISYQWQRKKVGETVFTDISGATSASLNITNIGDATNPHLSEYQCVITVNGCPVTSNSSILNVNSIVGTLAAQTTCEGANVTFDLSNYTLVGTVSSYQWQKRVGTSGSWSDVVGATSSTLNLANVSATDAAYYRCRVIFSNGGTQTCTTYSSTGNGAKLTVNAKPATPTNTTPASVCSGSTLTFSATGSNLLWYSASTGGVGSTTDPSYSAAGTYTAYVSQTVNGCESDRLPITAEIKSTVSPIPTNTTPAVVCSGSTLTFSATGNNLLWYNVATGGTGTTTAPTYTAGGTYVAYVSQTIDGCESARLQINAVIPNPAISVQPTNQSDCDGNSVSFKITASTTTGGTLTYQWQLKKPSDATFTNIASTTANTLNISNVGDANNPAGTQYQCIVSENGCPITSNVATLSVNSVAGSLAAQTLCEGASTTFDVSGFSITGTPTYQWQKRVGTSGSWLDITGATTSILSLSNVTSADDAYYRCKFTFTNLDNTTCIRYTSTGNGAKLTVNAKPALPISTTSASACSGSVLTFSATGSNLLWYNAATGGVGSTTAPSYSAAGTYTAYVSQTVNGCESDRLPITAEIKSTVSPIPTNTTPAVVCSGSTLTFSATGNNLLWYNVATGGTGSTTAPVYSAGGTYVAYVSQTIDGCESARLQINAVIQNPTITVQPTNQSDCDGNSVSFKITASTTTGGTLTYQWQLKKPSDATFTNIASAIANTLNISNVGDANNPAGTQYQCIVSENGCPITSNVATLSVNSVAGTLAAQTLCEGASTTFDVSGFSITGTPTYQWQKRVGTSGSWLDITGATTSILSLSNVSSADDAYYRCRFTFTNLDNTTCIRYTSTGNGAKLTINAKPALPISTTSTSACSGSILTFSATGSNLLWYSASTGGVGSTTAPSYSAAGTYTAYVSQTVNGCESDRLSITAEIKSTVSPIPTNTTPAVVCSGNTLTFSATGNNLLWYNVVTGGTGTTVAPTYTAGGTYVAYVSQTIDGCESARLQINAVIPNPTITVQPSNQSDCDGNSVSFKITASTTTGGTLTYQWQLKKPSDATFTNIASATANTLNISNVGDANNPAGTQYQCIVSENGCPIMSNVATLSVNSVAGSLAAQTLCEGASTTFDVSGFSITGTPAYQWQKRVGTSGSWLDITGATTSILSLSNVTSADDAYYRCKFTLTNLDNTTCIRYTSTGNGAKLTINANPPCQ